MHTAGEKQPALRGLAVRLTSNPKRQEDLEQVTKDWGSWGSDDVEGLKREPGYKTKFQCLSIA